MSSMQSAPATIAATSEVTFRSALAPASPGRVRCLATRPATLARSANARTGASPARETRFGSSTVADNAGK